MQAAADVQQSHTAGAETSIDIGAIEGQEQHACQMVEQARQMSWRVRVVV